MEKRKLLLTALLTEAVRIIKEEAVVGAAPVATPPMAPPAPPAAPVPPAQSEPVAPAQPVDGAPVVFDVDAMIEKLNLIRSGKSFADPEVYGQITTYFNALNDSDKSILENFLQSVSVMIVDQDATQPGMQTQTSQTPGAPPAPAPTSGQPGQGMQAPGTSLPSM